MQMIKEKHEVWAPVPHLQPDAAGGGLSPGGHHHPPRPDAGRRPVLVLVVQRVGAVVVRLHAAGLGGWTAGMRRGPSPRPGRAKAHEPAQEGCSRGCLQHAAQPQAQRRTWWGCSRGGCAPRASAGSLPPAPGTPRQSCGSRAAHGCQQRAGVELLCQPLAQVFPTTVPQLQAAAQRRPSANCS